jgi:hypothetical protein
MAGLNGLVLGFKTDANVRVHKFTAMVKSTVNASVQTDHFAKVPTGANAAGILGVSVDHFVEPNYFVGQPVGSPGAGTNYPENVTGSTPATYSLLGKPIALQVNGVARCISGVSSISQGDILIIADAYGRVKPFLSSDFGSGQPYHAIGYAQHGVSSLDAIVLVLLDFFTGTA